MNRPLVVILVMAACTFVSIPGFSQDGGHTWTVETVGTGLIANDDLAGARNKAIDDALRKAVEQAAASLIPLHTLDKKRSQAIKDGIYVKSDQYIQDYKIISEREIQKVYVVDVRSAVFIGSIRDDLHALGFLTLEKETVAPIEIAVTVKGLKSCADYVRAKELLTTKLRGVRNVYQREITWGAARLGLDFQGSVESLSDELIKTGHFSLVTALINQNYFEVTFSK